MHATYLSEPSQKNSILAPLEGYTFFRLPMRFSRSTAGRKKINDYRGYLESRCLDCAQLLFSQAVPFLEICLYLIFQFISELCEMILFIGVFLLFAISVAGEAKADSRYESGALPRAAEYRAAYARTQSQGNSHFKYLFMYNA